jgi:hypothetical protein
MRENQDDEGVRERDQPRDEIDLSWKRPTPVESSALEVGGSEKPLEAQVKDREANEGASSYSN